MSKLSGGGVPTMIVPSGTQIQVDAHGQLSIRTPGNLVLQNSGSYNVLESVSGSIRIEPDVHVEAVTLRCAETCFVQGSLTAWRVIAKTLHLDGKAEAHVVMQETERLEVGRQARMVGNFRSEKELFGLFSRFTRQVRALPMPGIAETAAAEASRSGDAVDAEEVVEPPAAEEEPRLESSEGPDGLPEALFFALLLLEREAERDAYGASSQRILRELATLLREGDVETLRHTWRTLFSRVRDPGHDVRRARDLVAGVFETAGDGPPPVESP